MKGIFITGTDTDVGKTYVAAAWTRALRARGVPALALKPISCGDRKDAEAFARANGETLSLNEINPLFLAPPLAPYAASVIENRLLDVEGMIESLRALAKRFEGPFLVEGAGGWLVPIRSHYGMRELAQELGLPVVIVGRLGLGTLNHSLLTVESVRAAGLKVAGIVLSAHGSDPQDMSLSTNPAILEDIAKVPVAVMESSGEIPETVLRWL
jgi:dethiobiotin synthetase